MLPEIGTKLTIKNWNGKLNYFVVVGYATAPACRFAEGETYMDYINGEQAPVCKYTTKAGRELKYPAARVDNWKDAEEMQERA